MNIISHRLGGTDLTVSSVGMGCSKLGAFWQGRSPRDGTRALLEARAHGVSFFDTADCYARGLSERLVGRALKHHDDVVIATKVGSLKTPIAVYTARRTEADGKLASLRDTVAGMRPGRHSPAKSFEAGYVETAVQRSLRRLDRDAIDLLMLHNPSAKDLREARFFPALERLVAEGHLRWWGVSVSDIEASIAVASLPTISCVQLPVPLAQHQDVRAALGAIPMIVTQPLGDGGALAAADAAGVPRDAVITACMSDAQQLGATSVIVGFSRPESVASTLGGPDVVESAEAFDIVRRIRANRAAA